MTSLAVIVGLLFAGHQPAQQQRTSRGALAGIESNFDQRFEKFNIADPFDLLGNTRGVYLPGYGVVFSAELNLVVTANPSPFRAPFTKQDIARLHAHKLERVPQLKQIMREMLITAATSLDNVAPNEQIVLAVSLFHFSWEDASGLPGQIVVQAQRQQLLNGATRESAIRTEEY